MTIFVLDWVHVVVKVRFDSLAGLAGRSRSAHCIKLNQRVIYLAAKTTKWKTKNGH